MNWKLYKTNLSKIKKISCFLIKKLTQFFIANWNSSTKVCIIFFQLVNFSKFFSRFCLHRKFDRLHMPKIEIKDGFFSKLNLTFRKKHQSAQIPSTRSHMAKIQLLKVSQILNHWSWYLHWKLNRFAIMYQWIKNSAVFLLSVWDEYLQRAGIKTKAVKQKHFLHKEPDMQWEILNLFLLAIFRPMLMSLLSVSPASTTRSGAVRIFEITLSSMKYHKNLVLLGWNLFSSLGVK